MSRVVLVQLTGPSLSAVGRSSDVQFTEAESVPPPGRAVMFRMLLLHDPYLGSSLMLTCNNEPDG